MSFDSLGLSEEILRAINKSGYTTPTPIQEKAIPAILDGRDVMAAAQTGTGKTAGFTLPILEMQLSSRPARAKRCQCLVLTPTRELAMQVQESVVKYSTYMQLKTAVIYGGVSMHKQIMKLKKGVDIVVATPGRLLDLYRQKAIMFDDVDVLVLDEADRMLDMGFMPDIKSVLEQLPEEHQTLMFSATFSDAIRKLGKGIMNEAVEINVAAKNSTVKNIQQTIFPVDKSRKQELLKTILAEKVDDQAIIFCKTKHGADKLSKKLNDKGFRTDAIHGNKTQGQRTRVLNNFKKNKTQILVATDVAARGIDVSQLSYVINFDLPQVAEDYVHRIGRTGRAGASGYAFSLVSADEANLLFAIERAIKQKISREEIEGFEPEHNVPDQEKKRSGNKSRFSRNSNKRKSPRRDGDNRARRSQGNSNQGNSNQDKSANGNSVKARRPRKRKLAAAAV